MVASADFADLTYGLFAGLAFDGAKGHLYACAYSNAADASGSCAVDVIATSNLSEVAQYTSANVLFGWFGGFGEGAMLAGPQMYLVDPPAAPITLGSLGGAPFSAQAFGPNAVGTGSVFLGGGADFVGYMLVAADGTALQPPVALPAIPGIDPRSSVWGNAVAGDPVGTSAEKVYFTLSVSNDGGTEGNAVFVSTIGVR